MYKESILLICLLFGCWLQASQAEDRIITQELKSTPDGQLFYVELGVGEGPSRQTFNLLVATTYAITWLPSAQLRPSRGYVPTSNIVSKLVGLLSKTATGYGGQFYRVYSDTVQIGSQVVPNQQFAVVYPQDYSLHELPVESRLDGMLGLGFFKLHDRAPEYLFRNLYISSYIDRLKFSLYINNSATDYNDANQAKGALVLGGVDESYYTGDINYAKLYEDPWGVDDESLVLEKTLVISAIQLDWSRVREDKKIPVKIPVSLGSGRVNLHSPLARMRLDTSTKLFIGDQKILDTIHLDILGAHSVGRFGLYVFKDCHLDNKPDLVFSVDGLEFTITPDDYVLQGGIDDVNSCFSAFKPYIFQKPEPLNPNLSALYDRVWVFGTKFLRKYYTVFDYENDVVGFATPK